MKIAVLGAGGMGGGIWSTLKDHPLVNNIVMVDNRLDVHLAPGGGWAARIERIVL